MAACRKGQSPILETHTMDFTARVHFAQRDDGQWFTRVQGRDPRYGYRWGAWRVHPGPDPERHPHTTGRCARLPRQ